MSNRTVRDILFEATEALTELYAAWVSRGVIEGEDEKADQALQWFLAVSKELEEATAREKRS